MVDMPNGSPFEPRASVIATHTADTDAPMRRKLLEQQKRACDFSVMLASERYIDLPADEQKKLCEAMQGSSDEVWQALKRLRPGTRRAAMMALSAGLMMATTYSLAIVVTHDAAKGERQE